MTRWTIYYQSRELARELGDPQLGEIDADSKEQAEALAHKDAEIARRAMPCASLWAVRAKEPTAERSITR